MIKFVGLIGCICYVPFFHASHNFYFALYFVCLCVCTVFHVYWIFFYLNVHIAWYMTACGYLGSIFIGSGCKFNWPQCVVGRSASSSAPSLLSLFLCYCCGAAYRYQCLRIIKRRKKNYQRIEKKNRNRVDRTTANRKHQTNGPTEMEKGSVLFWLTTWFERNLLGHFMMMWNVMFCECYLVSTKYRKWQFLVSHT